MTELVKKDAKIFVAGHKGMVGSAIVRNLQSKGYARILTKARQELDLLDQQAVLAYLKVEQPEYIFIAAAKVGGILANNAYRADFLYQNLMIEMNLIHGAHEANIQRLCFLGSSCIYPRDCLQPIREEYLLTGPLEQTNEPYAIAKIAGIKLCESFNRQHGRQYISAMPTNLYGPGDNYHSENSHVIPALIRRIHEAKVTNAPSVTVWGTGLPMREFLYVDDMAEACVCLMNVDITHGSRDQTMPSHINVGYGTDVSIKDLARVISLTVGYKGIVNFDISKPDGTPKKLMDSSRIRSMGWLPAVSLEQGLKHAYDDFLNNSELRR